MSLLASLLVLGASVVVVPGGNPCGIPVGGRDTVRSTISPGGDIDTFVFEACEGAKLRVTLSAGRRSALQPTIELVGPASLPIDISGNVKVSRQRLRVGQVELPVTGRYAVRVRGAGGTDGTYKLKVSCTAPKKRVFAAVSLIGQETAELRFGAPPGTRVTATLRSTAGAFSIASVRDVANCELAGGVASLPLTNDGTRAVGKLPALPAFGDYAVVVSSAAPVVRLNATFKLKYPKTKKRTRDLSAAEPVIAALGPAVARPGERISVLGGIFQVPAEHGGELVVLFGDVPGDFPAFVNDRRIDVTVPAGEGTVDVTVFNPDGQEGCRPAAFRFDDEPEPPPPEPKPDPAADALVAHWGFDEGVGTSVSDLSGNGHAGTALGAPQWTFDALDFDGIDDQVAYPRPNSPPPAAIGALNYGTVSVWFRYDDIENDGTPAEVLPILHFGTLPGAPMGTEHDSLSVYIAHGNLNDPGQRQIYFTVIENDRVDLCFDSGSLTMHPQTWYHYAAVIGPNGHAGYLNGTEFARHYNAGTGENDHAFFATVESQETLIAGSGRFGLTGNSWHFNGQIADVRIYDRPLSAVEVAELASSR